MKRVVQAGRGYSFSVDVDDLPNGPVYFPAARVACTPVGDRLRVAGMMEFRQPEAALDRRRIKAIVEAARPLLKGADLDHRQDEWVGSRPCTVDGLPLIGATGSPRVFVAGGHGMWGITLGPVTGRLLAEQMVTGKTPDGAAPVQPAALTRHPAPARGSCPGGGLGRQLRPEPSSAAYGMGCSTGGWKPADCRSRAVTASIFDEYQSVAAVPCTRTSMSEMGSKAW